MDYYLALKINEPSVNEITWMNLTITILGERSQEKIILYVPIKI